jgi:hypothetical protein
MVSSVEPPEDKHALVESEIGESNSDDPGDLRSRWEKLEWKSLMALISETKSAPNAAGRLDLRCLPWDDIDLSKGNLRWADLRGASLRRAKLNGADLCGLDLREVHADEANFKGADLCAANLSGAVLPDADFSFSDLSYAKFLGSNLTRAKLTGADLSAVDFSDAKMTDADLAGALYDSETKWPEGFSIEGRDMILED